MKKIRASIKTKIIGSFVFMLGVLICFQTVTLVVNNSYNEKYGRILELYSKYNNFTLSQNAMEGVFSDLSTLKSTENKEQYDNAANELYKTVTDLNEVMKSAEQNKFACFRWLRTWTGR